MQTSTHASHILPQSLRLSNKARHTSTVGEIVNLMSVDAQHFVRLMRVNGIWSIPLQIIVSLIFLYFTMGVSIFAGFAVMVLMILINVFIAAYTKKLQSKKMTFKDSRIRLLNDVLYGIKVILCQLVALLPNTALTGDQVVCMGVTISEVDWRDPRKRIGNAQEIILSQFFCSFHINITLYSGKT